MTNTIIHYTTIPGKFVAFKDKKQTIVDFTPLIEIYKLKLGEPWVIQHWNRVTKRFGWLDGLTGNYYCKDLISDLILPILSNNQLLIPTIPCCPIELLDHEYPDVNVRAANLIYNSYIEVSNDQFYLKLKGENNEKIQSQEEYINQTPSEGF